MRRPLLHGAHDVRVENVPEPKIINGRDALVKITLTAQTVLSNYQSQGYTLYRIEPGK